MNPTDLQAFTAALQQLQQAGASSGGAGAFGAQVLGAFLATVAVLVPALVWLRGRLPGMIRTGLQLEARDAVTEHEEACPARQHYHQRAGDIKPPTATLGVALALVLLVGFLSGCQPFIELNRDADFRGAFYVDCDKAPGETTPSCYIRTVKPSDKPEL